MGDSHGQIDSKSMNESRETAAGVVCQIPSHLIQYMHLLRILQNDLVSLCLYDSVRSVLYSTCPDQGAACLIMSACMQAGCADVVT